MQKKCVKKTFYYKLARNSRSCVGVEGFSTIFRYSRDFDLCEWHTPFKKPGILYGTTFKVFLYCRVSFAVRKTCVKG